MSQLYRNLFASCLYDLFFLQRWSTQRIVFGKPLTSLAVIRSKLAAMISRVEGCQNWFETITYQMNNVCMTEFYSSSTMLISPCTDDLQPTVRQTCGSHWFTQTVGPSLLVLSLTSSSILPRYISRSGRETAEGDCFPSISERLHSTHPKSCRCHSSIWRPSIDGYWDGQTG